MRRPCIGNAALIVASMMLRACIDTTPLPFTEPEGKPTVPEAGADGSTLEACRLCVVGDAQPCRAEWDACRQDPKCEALVECIFADGCFTIRDLADRIACGGPCFEQVGVMGGDDPALQAALPINVCTQEPAVCGDVCIVQ